jgi:anaphase-promoting complex subunit 6
LTTVRRYADALRLIDSVNLVRLQPDAEHDPSIMQQLNEAALFRAYVLHELGRFDAALAAASQLQNAVLSEADACQRDAILMRCAFKLRMWRRCADHAETLLVQDNDHLAVEALCTIGRITCVAFNRPDSAGNFFQQALERDATCSTAWDAIVDQWLLPPESQRELLATLSFPPYAESLRDVYAARIMPSPRPDAASTISPLSSDRSPLGATDIGCSANAPDHVVRFMRARANYQTNALREALGDVSASLAEWPEYVDAIVLKLAILVDLRATNELFEFAHRVADELKPSPALSAYAVGCYHFSVAAFDDAGRYFCRATELDPYFAPGWIAYGNNYARLEEGEQALNAYRRGQALFPGLTALRVLIGVQHLRVGNAPLALCFLEEADANASGDPLTLNEMGVHALRHERDLDAALHFFTAARDALPNRDQPSEYHDCILFNLATVLRRLGHHEQALQHFQHYVRVRPYAVAGHAGLGLTHHILGNLKQAITHYHAALALKADSVCRELLERALREDMNASADRGFQPGPSSAMGDDSASHHHDGGWMDSELGTHPPRGFARPSASPGAASPSFAMSAISRIARSESQAPAIGEPSPAGVRAPPAPPATGINRALAF